MKVQAMLELAKECDLQTVSEAYSNVNLHYSSLFVYSEIDNEFHELHEEMKKFGMLKLHGEVHDEQYWKIEAMAIDEAMERIK